MIGSGPAGVNGSGGEGTAPRRFGEEDGVERVRPGRKGKIFVWGRAPSPYAMRLISAYAASFRDTRLSRSKSR